ncbi:hypothetical protein Pmani_025675 [Petrolisthes manimaculis]|uniref:Small ribosomal subunit protein uS9m n=1 Tax=Petrolisthes manimaculis TaxID=1843537 RepID=A0AAE1U0Y1_9EUCA|nr:hypothetical protein Pmani_025675 [Petrolisthes manimaculis]
MKKYSVKQEQQQQLNVGFASSQWVTKEELENILLEHLKDKHYEFFLSCMKRLATHTYSHRANDFIMRFRKPVKSVLAEKEIPKLLYTSEGRPYMSGVGKRKLSLASVTVFGRGTGTITINENKNILYFDDIQCREQIIYPLQFTGLLGKVDVVADVEGGGPCGQAGAIRYALSQALMAFTDKDMVEKMRLGGLLTRDPRMKERQKPGQKGARAKYTWKKR